MTKAKVLGRVMAILTSFMLGIMGTALSAQSTMETIQERGTLRIGVAQAPPWFSQDPKSGEWNAGLGIATGQAMADALGVELEPVEITWATAIAALQTGKIDIQLQLDATPARALVVDFPKQPYNFVSLAVLSSDELDASSWAELNTPDVSLSVPQGSSIDAFMTRNLPEANIQRFPDNAAAIAAFQAGRVDGVSLFFPPLLAALKKIGSGKVVIPTPAFNSPASAAVRREEDKTFRDWVDHTLYYYYETGQTQRWYEEFLTDYGLDPKEVPPIQRELLFTK